MMCSMFPENMSLRLQGSMEKLDEWALYCPVSLRVQG